MSFPNLHQKILFDFKHSNEYKLKNKKFYNNLINANIIKIHVEISGDVSFWSWESTETLDYDLKTKKAIYKFYNENVCIPNRTISKKYNERYITEKWNYLMHLIY